MTAPTSGVDRLPTVSLDELNDVAQLLTRTDRKYVVPAGELDAVVTGIPGLRVLEVDGPAARATNRRTSTPSTSTAGPPRRPAAGAAGRSAAGSTPTPASGGSR